MGQKETKGKKGGKHRAAFLLTLLGQYRPSAPWHLKCSLWTPSQLGVGGGTETVEAVRAGSEQEERLGREGEEVGVWACSSQLWTKGQNCEMGSLGEGSKLLKPHHGKLVGKRGIWFSEEG